VEARGSLPEGASWLIEMVNRIPLSRGLGSSAAATVGGLLAANALLGDALSTADLLRLATAIEGHPDNAAAALLGGFVASAALGDTVEAIRFDVPRGIRAVIFIPDLRLSTAEMRKVLPSRVPRADAVANLGRVALGVAGMATGRRDSLRILTEDRLHEPYRASAYPQLPRLVDDARKAGAIGACLSGSGSSIVAFTDKVSGLPGSSRPSGRSGGHGPPRPGRGRRPRNAPARVIAGALSARRGRATAGSNDPARGRVDGRHWSRGRHRGSLRVAARAIGLFSGAVRAFGDAVQACSASSSRSCPDCGCRRSPSPSS
jgi:hypothetical protein